MCSGSSAASVATGAAVVMIVGLALWEWRRRPSWAVPAFLLRTIGGQFALVHVIKALIERARPDISQLTGFAGASFPSGHAAAAATIWAVAALVLSRGTGRRFVTALPGVAIGIAVAVAATRVMLGVPWFTDVLAGLAVGWGLVRPVLDRLRRTHPPLRRTGRGLPRGSPLLGAAERFVQPGDLGSRGT